MSDRANHSNDNILVINIRNDDKVAFKSLYDRYGKKIYYFSLRFLGNNQEAEDLVQSVFMNLWLNRKMLDDRQEIRSYIYKSAVNAIYNIIIRRSVRDRYYETAIREDELFADVTYEKVIGSDLEELISSIVEHLPEQQRQVFTLSRIECMTYEEIAEKLGISLRTVENHMYRALKVIRKKLRGNI